MPRLFTLSFVAVVTALFLSAYVVAGGADDEHKPKPADTGDKMLSERIAVLEKRVAELEELEKRVTALEQLSGQTIIRSYQLPPGSTEPLPPGWQEHEFNGLRYYLVPLNEQNAPPATKRAPLKGPAVPTQSAK